MEKLVAWGICFSLTLSACGSEDHGAAAEPSGRGAPKALFSGSTLNVEEGVPRSIRAVATADAPALVSCRLEGRDRGDAVLWVSSWFLVRKEEGTFSVPLDDAFGQEALNHCGPGSTLLLDCRARVGSEWVRGEERLFQPLPLMAPQASMTADGLVLRLPAGGLVGWVLAAPAAAVSPHQAHWTLLEGGGDTVTLPAPGAGDVLHYWWGPRVLPCLRGGTCEVSAWTEVMLWLRHSEVPHESAFSYHAEARH